MPAAFRTLLNPTGETDPNFANVTLLLHMDGSNGSTTFTDNSLNSASITASGNAQISTTQSKFGGASGYFDGNGDYISSSSASITNFGTGDFTVEFWFYSTITGAISIFDSRTNETAPNGNGFVIGTNASSQWVVYQGSNRIIGSTLSTNTWIHVAVSRSGSSVRMFLNGNQTGSTWTTTNSFTDAAFLIGTDYPKNARFVNGYIDDLRVTTVARYTANFTAPTEAFPDS